MQKLKYAVLEKMIEKEATSAEINFILYISHFQDDAGNVLGVYYRDIMKALHISAQKFYDILYSLEEKGIIRVEKNFYSDWDIQILDNDFTYKGAYQKGQEGYLSTQHNIFYSEDFMRLKAGEKLLAMCFLKVNLTKEGAEYTKSGSYHLGVKKFYDTYKDLFKTTKRVIQGYLTKLRSWFSIGIKEGQYYITALQKVRRKPYGNRTDKRAYQDHIGAVACRRGRFSFTKQTFHDAAALATQFAKQLKAPLMGQTFLAAVKESLELANETCRNRYKWQRVLQPKLINKCIVDKIKAMGF